LGSSIRDKIIFFSLKVIVLRLTLRFIKFNLHPNLTFNHSTVVSTTQKKNIEATRARGMSILAIHFQDITGGQYVWTVKGEKQPGFRGAKFPSKFLVHLNFGH